MVAYDSLVQVDNETLMPRRVGRVPNEGSVEPAVDQDPPAVGLQEQAGDGFSHELVGHRLLDERPRAAQREVLPSEDHGHHPAHSRHGQIFSQPLPAANDATLGQG